MKNITQRFKDIENEFFELDHEHKKAIMRLHFDKPSDIFDVNAITKKPVLNDDFIDWVKCSFEYAPRKYKIDLDITFDDMEGYDEAFMKDLFFANTLLEAKRSYKSTLAKTRTAISLILLGAIFFVTMLLVSNLWQDGGFVKDMIAYIMDIGTTVTIWEAMTILIVENKEKRDLTSDLIRRYDSISFHLK